MDPKKPDVYQRITDRIVAQLEAGTPPWVKPWVDLQPPSARGMPRNGVTGHKYSGINILMTWGSGYTDARWYTFKQGIDLGAPVRKGEHGTPIVYASAFETTTTNANGDDETKRVPFLKSFTVFNHAQLDWTNAKKPTNDGDGDGDATPPDHERHERAEAVIAATGSTIGHGGDRAFYRPSTDSIMLPVMGAFRTRESYYATALHELTHWTSHETRCDRTKDLGRRFGDERYAAEELVAELGAAFLCGDVGIVGELQHAEYIASWIKVLKNDKRAIFTASRKAQEAVAFILNTAPAAEVEEAA